jgi:replicative DNA helicase
LDYDKKLVEAIIREGKPGLKAALDLGIRSEVLFGEGAKCFDFVLSYAKTKGEIPALPVVSEHVGVALQHDDQGGAASHWAEKIINRRLSKNLGEGLLEVDNLIDAKPREAVEVLGNLMLKLRKEKLAGTLIESLPALGKDVWEYYQKIKAGDHGILSPWPTINDATLGFWPEDLCLFVARLGIGKTWTSIMLAGCAWEQKVRDPNGPETLPDGTRVRPARVLYATTEMAKARIALRWYAIKLKLPYGALRRGQLGVFLEKNLEEGIAKFVDSPNFNIVGGDFDFSMESFDAAIDEANPDIVVLDGAYLLKVPGLTRQERAANAFDELKRINKRRKVPIIVTMQFNREVKTNQAKTVQAESIALTDVAGWNADLIYGLIQTDEMKKNKRLMLKPLKIREGESEEIECNWNFDTMDFSELPKAAGTSGGGSGGAGQSDAAEATSAGADPFSSGSDDVPF